MLCIDVSFLYLFQYLQDLKNRRARIIIGDFYDSAARVVMCEAYRQEMTAKQGYVWFLPVWLDAEWYNTTQHPGEVNCTTEQMEEVGIQTCRAVLYCPKRPTYCVLVSADTSLLRKGSEKKRGNGSGHYNIFHFFFSPRNHTLPAKGIHF